MKKRYELQLRHRAYGWVSAGNFNARTKREGLQTLRTDLARSFGQERKTYRLVELVAREIARVRSTPREKK